ncbi:CueP family metal-binding protein [Oceanobacillus sp. CAU 1775]
MRKYKVILLLLASILLLAACNETTQANTANDAEINIKQMVHEYSVGTFEDVQAAITYNELIITDENEEETRYPLPDDKFFVSIAPYENVTHPCEIHSLTGCQGEMVEEAFLVEILDSDGNLVMEENIKTMENGFIDLWLPRNEDYQVKMTHDGKVAEGIISTADGAQTCITTMQLKKATDEI